ncbi:unnamed protein product [Cladocopium goreaui]|uniref:Calmodulin n=1 Tax=Cladocopium goreaui TaxID=2562237 RepID=A0A9P1CWU1_9DINO|nr:unnamed protein product [Cladocopium goreaui]
MSQMARIKIEKLMKGKKLPFDDDCLEYLLSTAAAAEQKELIELLQEFCPKWAMHERATLAVQLKNTSRQAPEGSAGFPSMHVQPSTSSRAPEPFSAGYGQPDVPDEQLAADALLAAMLQEEEDAQATLNNPGGQTGTAKKGKKAYKPLNISYTVARGGNAGPALGTAAPSSLADVLRQKRSQQVLDTGPPTGPGPFGGPDAPTIRPTPWAPGGAGLSWAERVQMNQGELETGDALGTPPPMAGTRALHPLKLRVRWAQAEHHVEAQPQDTVGDVKNRLEKMHGIAFSLQRLMHQGRELRDNEALQPMADSQHQIYLSLHQREAPPRTVAGRNLQIKLQMPGLSVPSATTVPERITGAGLKEQIQKDHGIRSDHINLTFFGHPLRDDMSISDQGVAAGGCISVSIVSAAQRRQAERVERAATLAGMQLSAQGRVLDESEAVEAAIQASHPSQAGVSPVGPVELDEDNMGFEDLAEGDEEAVGDFNKDVAAQEPRFSGVVNQAKAIASHYRMEDYISRVSKRSGYRLTLLMQKTKKDKVIGFLVFRFRGRSLCVLQLAVAKDARGRGAGRSLLRWAAREAQRATMENVLISTWPFGSELFLKLGFAETGAMEGEDVNGQVWAIQARPLRAGRRVNESSRDQTKLSRKDLTRAVFQALNRSGSGCLTFDEMKPFAKHTGFEGSDAEWKNEFEELKQECRVNEIGLREFDHLVNDQSDAGCYCSDEELRDLLRSLPPLPPPSAATVPPPRAAVPVPGTVPGAPAGARQQLIDSVFHALNRSASGQLSAAEMRPFAEKTGFSGSNEEWQEEFNLLATECGGVVDFRTFQRLVNDESDAGCYCSDSDLRELLNALNALTALNASGVPNGFSATGADQVANAAPKAASQPTTARGELIAACFRGLNVSGSGHLSAAEMKRFAQHTGFGGTDQEWQAEFAILKQECKVSAIALKDFHRLVNDQSQAGCYCSDGELQALLESLPSAEPSGLDLGPAITKAQAQVLAPPSGPSRPSGPSARESLIFSAFRALNRSGSGHLSAAEMRPFAEITGFLGSDEDWRKEFELLRQECQSRHIDFTEFQRLVNDSSENGCYRNDDDLRLVVEKQNVPNGSGPVLMPGNQAPNGHQGNDQPGGDRAALIKSVFDALNTSGSSYLSAPEMRPLAELTGFTGTDQEWREEFDLLRQECDGSKPGIAFTDFERLVNDASDDGCYCEDANLRQLLKSHPPQAATAEAAKGLPAALSRRSLISAAFRALNRSGTGQLSAMEMRPFAELTGFSGTDREWQEEFELVRKECASSSSGIPFTDFERLVNDESEDGCYASDDTLRRLPSLIESKESKFSPGTGQQAEATMAKPRGDRADLVESAFRFLNRSGSGHLSAVEMRPFAELTGFTGTDREWQEEFELLRQECPHARIALSTFVRLVNDQSDNGRYASDDDLKKLLSSSRSQPDGSPDGRSALLRSVFAALNRSGSGQLSAVELRPLADRTGFQGSDSEWHEEFNLLRQECSGGEIRWNDFERLVNDKSDNGCHATDEELRELLDFLNRNSVPAVAVPVFRPPPGLQPAW